MTRRASTILALTFSLMMPGAALADDQACMAPEHHQFDFWLGQWNVKDTRSGDMAGKSRIEAIHGGCVISENWTDSSMTGGSLNIYDRKDGRWHQTWTDSTGRLAVFAGNIEDGAMVLTGEQRSPQNPSKTFLSRMKFTPLPEGRLRQQGERSMDGGESWEATFDLTYERAP